MGLNQTEPLADLALTVVRTYAEARTEANVLVRSVNPEAEEVLSIFVKRSEESGWQLGVDPVFPGDDAWPAPDITLTSVPGDEALEAVSDLLSKHRSPQGG